ncbi:hypothetical protein SISNIDRAFT_454611, partial [Sistotremastrum niveocremeum HHB9708]
MDKRPTVPDTRFLRRAQTKEPLYARIVRFTAIIALPTVAAYCVFIQDWGPREHVFSPAQRWYRRQIASFASLSPDEQSVLPKAESKNETRLS